MEAGKIKRHKSKSYITICNDIMKERELTLKAKGLFSMIMSLPEDWVFTIKGICSIIKEQSGAVSAAIHELIDAGYCFREEVRENGRYVGYNYSFYDKKQELPKSENPNSGNPKSGKAKQYNNSSNNTPIKELNEDYNKEKKLSDDNSKDALFEDFYRLYPLKKSRRNAEKAWAKLSTKDKKDAIEKLPAYIADCYNHKRSFQYPATYLNGGTWNDEFDSTEIEVEEPAEDLPDGLTREQWTKIVMFFCREIGLIAGKITPVMFVRMKSLAANNSALVMTTLRWVNDKAELDCNIDVMETYERIIKDFQNESETKI